jgi:hypothetical protein
VDATGHNWGQWQQTVAPSYDQEGEEKRICAVCEAAETRTVAAMTQPNTKPTQPTDPKPTDPQPTQPLPQVPQEPAKACDCWCCQYWWLLLAGIAVNVCISMLICKSKTPTPKNAAEETNEFI